MFTRQRVVQLSLRYWPLQKFLLKPLKKLATARMRSKPPESPVSVKAFTSRHPIERHSNAMILWTDAERHAIQTQSTETHS